MHYDVVGQGAESVELKVWRMTNVSRERIFSNTVRADGYYEADFVDDNPLYICFKNHDQEQKELSIMTNQVFTNKVEFAKMDNVEQVTQRLKDMQDDFDVISHNVAARINYDADIVDALSKAQL